jgi:hypothetical protein
LVLSHERLFAHIQHSLQILVESGEEDDMGNDCPSQSEIVIIFYTEDTMKAKEFAASADLKEAMLKAGALDTPTIYFLESID